MWQRPISLSLCCVGPCKRDSRLISSWGFTQGSLSLLRLLSQSFCLVTGLRPPVQVKLSPFWKYRNIFKVLSLIDAPWLMRRKKNLTINQLPIKLFIFFSWSSGLTASIRKSFLTERDVVGWVSICGLLSSHPTCVTSLWAGSRSPHRKTQKNCAWGSLRLSWRQDFVDTESWGGSIVRDLLQSWMGFGIITSSLCWTGWCPQHSLSTSFQIHKIHLACFHHPHWIGGTNVVFKSSSQSFHYSGNFCSVLTRRVIFSFKWKIVVSVFASLASPTCDPPVCSQRCQGSSWRVGV